MSVDTSSARYQYARHMVRRLAFQTVVLTAIVTVLLTLFVLAVLGAFSPSYAHCGAYIDAAQRGFR